MCHSRPVTSTTDQVLIRTAQQDEDDDVVCALMTEYMTWAYAKFEDTYGIPMTGTATHTPASLRPFRHPNGFVLLAEVGGATAGVAAARLLDPATLEIKRMYVRPQYRARHIGADLVDRVLAQAAEIGVSVVRLDTNRFMTGAQALYESRGFVQRPPYEESEIPAELRDSWVFYERHLLDL